MLSSRCVFLMVSMRKQPTVSLVMHDTHALTAAVFVIDDLITNPATPPYSLLIDLLMIASALHEPTKLCKS